MINQIYVDLDGVLFDFDGQIKTVTGALRNEMSTTEMWKIVNEYPGGWFRNLPPMQDALELLEACKSTGLPVTILTATGHHYEDVTMQKRDACLKHFGLTPKNIITVSNGLLKANLAHSKAVLIDDTHKVIRAWTEAGGIGIMHSSAESSVMKLKKLLPNS